jgi:hypothetical protein
MKKLHVGSFRVQNSFSPILRPVNLLHSRDSAAGDSTVIKKRGVRDQLGCAATVYKIDPTVNGTETELYNHFRRDYTST